MRSREAVGKAGWNPALAGKPQTIDDLKFANYFKEIYFDSDTKVALISGSGSEEPRDWFLTNEMKAEARAKVNQLTGSQAPDVARHLHARHAGLDGRRRPGHRPAQARLVQGLHGGRQHQQAALQAPLAHGRREAALPVLREARQGGARQRLRAQGALPVLDDQELPAARRLRRRERRGQGRQGLAPAELRHLPLGLPLHRRRGGERPGPVRADRARGLGDRSRGDSREVRGHQRLRRPRPDLRAEHGGRAAPVRGHDGHARQGPGRRPRGVGHRRDLDGRAAVADRGAAPAGDPRGHAEEVRLPGAGAGRRARPSAPSSARTRRASTSTTSSAAPS